MIWISLGNRLFQQLPRFLIKHHSTELNLLNKARIDHLRKMALPNSRDPPLLMQLNTPEFNSIFTEELRSLISIFKENGHEIRIAGGAVRDLLMGKEPKDLDFATTATPTQMKEMFESANIRMINMNGEKHGTITPRINDKANFEVTTLRIDVVTDGRHAEVQFTTDWLLDSLRRDLTINSMFLGVDGSVYDYFYGYDDLKKHRIAFVGSATNRIQEDYLRILRYFRFYGRIANEANKHETETLEAIRTNASGLKGVSGERIWMELKKIVEGNFAGELIQTMIESDVHSYIGLPVNPNIAELKRVWLNSGHLKLNAITLIAALLNNQDDAVALHSRLKLSAFERDLAMFLVEHRAGKPNMKPLMPYQQLVLKAHNSKVTQLWVVELLKYNNSPLLEEFQAWIPPKFPVKGDALRAAGVKSGRFMGLVLKELQNYWADHDFNLEPDELLKQVPQILSELEERQRNKSGGK